MAGIFTSNDLFRGGKPSSRDIEQNRWDCFLLATMGAVADQQPDLIRIAYDVRTTEFMVSLFKEGKRVEYPVTQTELRESLRQGGSTYDNRGTGPIWPAVMETAYAKSLDRNPADGLDEGWRALDQGGRPMDAMYALTGQTGRLLGAQEVASLGAEKTVQQLSEALAKGQPITLNTRAEVGKNADHLQDDHAYIVERAYIDAKGDARVALRNPWGAGAGNRNSEGREPPSIKVNDLIRANSVAYFNIGPAPATQTLSPDLSKGLPGSMDKLPTGLRQVVGMLNEMVDAIGAPNGEAALAGASRALGNLSAAQEFSLEGKREAELMPAQIPGESLRVTPRLGMVQTQRIGGM